MSAPGSSPPTRSRGRTAAALVLWSALGSVPALAQTASGTRGPEVGVNAVFLGPFPLGSATADLIRPSGGNLTLFSTQNSLSPGGGLEGSLAFRLGARSALEARGHWSMTRFRAAIGDDVEGVPDVTLSEAVSRFAVTGSIVRTIRERNRMAVFFRAGAGWMRELAGGGASAADGIVGNVGVGVKYWLRNQPRPQARRVGFSAEALAIARSGGLSRGSRAVRVAPAGAAGLVFGF